MAGASQEPGLPRGIRVGAGVISVIALLLCGWQIERHVERNAGREAALIVADTPPLGDADPASKAVLWRTVRWTGHFVGAPELVAGRQHADTLGYGVLQVFDRAGQGRVLVDRGWVTAEGVAERVKALTADGEGEKTLTGQLRPVAGKAAAKPVAGHGTRIWPYGSTAAAVAGNEVEAGLYVVAGAPDGASTASAPMPLDGFDRVPPRDDTSAHYASQWFAIALIAAAFSSQRAMNLLRLFASHRYFR